MIRWFFVIFFLCWLLPLGLQSEENPKDMGFRYGRSFHLELERHKLTLKELNAQVVIIKEIEDFSKIPFTPRKRLHFKNFKNLHRYVFSEEKNLIIDKNWAESEKALSFILVSLGETPYAAGLIGLAKDRGGENQIFITNRSKRFCTPFERVQDIKKHLVELGLKDKQIHLKRNKPKSCESVLTRQEKLIENFSKKKKESN